MRCGLGVSCFVLAATLAGAQEGTPLPPSMASLLPQHPRLFVHDDELPEIRKRIAVDRFARSEFVMLQARANTLLRQAPNAYQLTGEEHTLLPIARDIENRVFTLAGIYRLTGEHKYADRAIREMLAAAAFKDWYPNHFLDTAEVTTALAVGYDWLYSVLTPVQRTTIRQAMLEKGIGIFLGRLHRNEVHYRNNWGQVCYGGETIGVLAIAEKDDPESLTRAAEMIGYARPGIDLLMKFFAPDGGFEEGPVYWNYATAYNVLYLAALDTALGTNFGEADALGFSLTPRYRMQSLGPIDQYANFGDAQPEAFPAPQMYWLGAHFHHREYTAHEMHLTQALRGKMHKPAELESVRFSMFGLFWYALAPKPEGQVAPRVESFARISQAFLRSAWNDRNAWYAGYKGGNATASHGHLDLGSFVLDGFGERWAVDLARDDYALPGYFGKQRWDYYRTQTQSHNTITVDGPNEDLDAIATVELVRDLGRSQIVVSNLDQVYKGKLKHWTRALRVVDGEGVLLQDELEPAHPIDLTWHFHTRADVSVSTDRRTATLTVGGISIQAHLLAPADAGFEAIDASRPPAPNASNPGLIDLTIHQPKVTAPETVSVSFRNISSRFDPLIQPIATWPGSLH
jgi:hypothetical protein